MGMLFYTLDEGIDSNFFFVKQRKDCPKYACVGNENYQQLSNGSQPLCRWRFYLYKLYNCDVTYVGTIVKRAVGLPGEARNVAN